MRTAVLVCVGLFNFQVWAAAPSFPLGIDYSEIAGLSQLYGPYGAKAIATDPSRAIYVLADTGNPDELPSTAVLGPTEGTTSVVLKLSPAGDNIVYLTVLGFNALGMAVDGSGAVYLAGTDFIAKLNSYGTAFIYRTLIGAGVALAALVVDTSGRVYVAGSTSSVSVPTTAGSFEPQPPSGGTMRAFLIRYKPDGTAVDYGTYLAGTGYDVATAVTVDTSGSAIVAGISDSPDFPLTPGAYSSTADGQTAFLARFSPDGSSLIYSTLLGVDSLGLGPIADTDGGAVVVGGAGTALMRFNPNGTIAFVKPLSPLSLQPTGLTVDTDGNAYLAGLALLANNPTKNGLSICGTAKWPYAASYLSVYDPAGNMIQGTYLPYGLSFGALLAVAPGPALYAISDVPVDYTPTRQIRGLTGGYTLTRFSPQQSPQTVRLACVGSAASFDPGPIAPGELVSLFGQGMGPVPGQQPEIDLKIGFPDQFDGVQVTFNGKPGPILYASTNQINAIAPWSLQGALSVEICVIYAGSLTNCIERAVADSAPSVFTTDGVHAAAINQDGTINSASNPAKPGTIVSIFATGLGPIDPPQKDGGIVGLQPPVNRIPFQAFVWTVSGFDIYPVGLQTQYAGPAPLEVAGVSQINFMAPVIFKSSPPAARELCLQGGTNACGPNWST